MKYALNASSTVRVISSAYLNNVGSQIGFLDPDNPSVTLLTMDKAAVVLGKRLRVELVDELA